MKIPNTAACKKLAATGARREILAALARIRDYRARRWADLSFIEVQALDRSAAILSASL